MLKLYRTPQGPIVQAPDGKLYRLEAEWDSLLSRDDLFDFLTAQLSSRASTSENALASVLAPIGAQEVWAAGVTYYRSRNARMEESKSAGGGDFYDRVYSAERPELFFKATPHRVVGSGAAVAIRSDAKWSVPEPELTLVLSPAGSILGYTIGNDMSSRDIEGENPLYLPQAKVYSRSCSLGPCILVTKEALPKSTAIELLIKRRGDTAFEGSTTLESIKRELPVLAAYLFRDNSFPAGAFLMTGTGIVPPDSFTLQAGDEISITIPPIGTLFNPVG